MGSTLQLGNETQRQRPLAETGRRIETPHCVNIYQLAAPLLRRLADRLQPSLGSLLLATTILGNGRRAGSGAQLVDLRVDAREVEQSPAQASTPPAWLAALLNRLLLDIEIALPSSPLRESLG